MPIQVGFKLLISDEPLSAVCALELDSFVNLGDRHYIELFQKLGQLSYEVLIEQVRLLQLNKAGLLIEVFQCLVHLRVVLAVKFVLNFGECVIGVGEIMSK